jgi:hypothetical protein
MAATAPASAGNCHPEATRIQHHAGDSSIEFDPDSPTVEKRQSTSDLPTETLPRAVSYLEPVQVVKRNVSHKPVGMLRAEFLMWTAGFITDEEEDLGDITKLREVVFNESANMGIISALVATLVFPMWLENGGDYLGESEFEGLLADAAGHAWMEANANWLADISTFAYFASSVSFFFSVLASIYVLLGVNSMPTDEAVGNFVKNMGFAMKLPYLFFQMGMICFISIIMRAVFEMKTYAYVVLIAVIVLPLVTTFHFLSQNRAIRSLWNARAGCLAYTPFMLTKSAVELEVKAYFEHAVDQVCLQECLRGMQAIAPDGARVPVAPLTANMVTICFHKRRAAMLGLELSDADIYGLL